MKRAVNIGSAAAVFALLVAAIALEIASAQTPVEEIDKDSETTSLAFDHDLKAVDGSTIAIDQAEFVFQENPPTANPPKPPVRVLRTMQPITAGANLYAVRQLLVTVPVGEYDITVRVRSNLGNWSAESPTLHRRVVSKKPTTPTNFREERVGDT